MRRLGHQGKDKHPPGSLQLNCSTCYSLFGVLCRCGFLFGGEGGFLLALFFSPNS